MIVQFLFNAMLRSAGDKSAAPKLPVMLMFADVVNDLSTKFVNISTNAPTPSWQFAKPTVLANTISQRSRDELPAAKLALKSVPAVGDIEAVDNAGID